MYVSAGIRYTNSSSADTWNLVKIIFVYIPFPGIQSGYKFAYARTVPPLWIFVNIGLIEALFRSQEQNEFLHYLDHELKKSCEMGPWFDG